MPNLNPNPPHTRRDGSGFVTKAVFVDALVRQAQATGLCDSETGVLQRELEAEFRWVLGYVI
jgi:hypothetical protein